MAILLVEDNADLRDATKLLLEADGYEVVAAEHGGAAFAALQHGTRPTLILLDLMMPEMDGFEFRAQQLKDPELASIPVVVWSGQYLDAIDRDRLHGTTILMKPTHPDVMLRTLEAQRLR